LKEALKQAMPEDGSFHRNHAALSRQSWPVEAYAKHWGGMSSLVGVKGEPQEVVALDTFVLPVDRGPAGSDMRLLRSWQYKATGKVAAAAVLAELKAAHLHSGGPQGICAKACEVIAEKKMDDTFYIVDLGNTMRMLKAS